MSQPPLIDAIENIEWGPESLVLFDHLTGFSAADEGGAVILVAAAVLLAGEAPGAGLDDAHRLIQLGAEFTELVRACHTRLSQGHRQPFLRVVGGHSA